MSVLILTEKELRNIVKIDNASIDAVANAFLWLSKGLVTMPPIMHITAIGADLPEKQEIMSEVFAKADIIACDKRSQSFSAGELFNAKADGIQLDENQVLELGDIISGIHMGRQSEEQITICDFSGTGVQDTAIADLALKQAENQNLGIKISMD